MNTKNPETETELSIITTDYVYPTKLKIFYNTNSTYRNCLRTLFKMNPNNFPKFDMDLDDETRDENDYDIDSAAIAMNTVLHDITKNSFFLYLLDKAAARMFSTDREIGLSILFSYDYLDVFHNCLVYFYTNESEFTDTTDCYVELLKRLS
uniref:Uncharacterized protein n=1 Tax=viral metagenome TaxID=1070528 RepID=A0A6C0E9D8_9ZZZZ